MNNWSFGLPLAIWGRHDQTDAPRCWLYVWNGWLYKCSVYRHIHLRRQCLSHQPCGSPLNISLSRAPRMDRPSQQGPVAGGGRELHMRPLELTMNLTATVSTPGAAEEAHISLA